MNKLNKCDEKFLNWFSNTYGNLKEGEDFSCDVDFMYEIWKKCWSSAYSVGRLRGHQQGYHHGVYVKTNSPLHPMPYYTMEDLFVGCKTGREFGLRVEKWHGIGSENNNKKNNNKPFSHLGCYSYPNCDEDPNGCFEQTAEEDIEEYGFKD